MPRGGAGLEQYDAVVIGGGPGGASAAYHLKKYGPGLRTLLIERMDDGKFGSYHRMCGEGLSKKGLTSLGLDLDRFILNRIDKAREFWPGNIVVETEIDGCIIDRTRLLMEMRDQFMRMGGETIIEEVLAIGQDSSSIRLSGSQGSISAKYVIAADGAHSRVRKTWFRSPDPEMVWAEQYVSPEAMEGNVIELSYDEKYHGGYAWKFPHADHCQIGFPKGCGEIPAGALEVHRRAIPLGETTSLVKGNVCLVGDAGGLVNPITFGGIRIAFESGRMAAQAVAGGDIASYEGRWKASRYADQKFYEGYRQLRSMDNAQLQGSMEPFRNGYGPLLYAKAMMGRSEYRGLYRAYASSMRFGW